MRSSNLFSKTLREAPSDAETISHQLLIRSGFIQQIASGIFSLMPLGNRSISKIRNIIREEMNNIGAQEVNLPVVQPRDIWEESGRANSFSPPLASFIDRRERQMVLAPTHEEAVTIMARANVKSYKDLPFILYQIQTKFRDEPRPRGGLLRVREFEMKDAYSFDIDEEGLDKNYNFVINAYKNIFNRCGIKVEIVEADSGGIGGKDSNEFVMLTDSGEDIILLSDRGDYAANIEKAVFEKEPNSNEEILDISEIYTPNIKSIQELSIDQNISKSKTLKSLLYSSEEKEILVVIRGDYDVNETKLRNLLGGIEVRLSNEKEIKSMGLDLGFISPVGLEGVFIIADDSISMGSNFFTGANKENYHLKNVNFHRDFKADIVADIAEAKKGYKVKGSEGILLEKKGIEVGHVFKLGTTYSKKMGAKYTDQDSNSIDILMGCYGIGIGRLLAAIVESNSDSKGMILPISIAPFQVCIVPIGKDNKKVNDYSEKLYISLRNKGIDVLFNDTDDPPGVKFNDLDLIGIPIRIVIGERNLKNRLVEIKLRNSQDFSLISLEDVENEILKLTSEK